MKMHRVWLGNEKKNLADLGSFNNAYKVKNQIVEFWLILLRKIN